MCVCVSKEGGAADFLLEHINHEQRTGAGWGGGVLAMHYIVKLCNASHVSFSFLASPFLSL